MSYRFYPIPIFLDRNEWERLKRQGGPLIPETAARDNREEYFDALNEQSRRWIDLWPDSAEGVREKIKEQRRNQRKDDKALIEAIRKSRKPHNSQEAVKQAKQLIFDDSCYGRQLISAITESNIIEEREAQIELQNEIKQIEADLEKQKTYSPLISDVGDEEMAANRKVAAIECVNFNEEIELKKKERAAKFRAEKIICESVDEDMVKQLREVKAKKKAEIKLLEKKGIEEHEAVRKDIAKHRKITEDRDNALLAVYKEEQDRMRCKVDAVLKKIIVEKRHGERGVKFYKEIDEIQKAKTKQYDDFVEKGIEMHEQRHAKQEAKDIEIENKRRDERYTVAEENKLAAKHHKLYIENTAPGNKCVCDVQTLLVKPDADKNSKKINEVEVKYDSEKNIEDGSQKAMKTICDDKDKFSFLKPRNKLVEALRRREKEPSGYTGVDAADKYFAEQASDALQRTKHKHFARKVVDEYLKINSLDASAISISNY